MADFSFLNILRLRSGQAALYGEHSRTISRYDVGGKESYAVSAEGQASQSPDLAYACWPFTKNVELQCVSSPRSARLACSGAAPPPAAPPLFFARAIFSPFGRVGKEFIVFLAPPAHAQKTNFTPQQSSNLLPLLFCESYRASFVDFLTYLQTP